MTHDGSYRATHDHSAREAPDRGSPPCAPEPVTGTRTLDWGTRLADAIRAALARGDRPRAQRLALEGDGLARDLAREYTFMLHGLGITVRIVLGQLVDLAAARPVSGWRDADTSDAMLVELLRRLSSGLRASLPACTGGAGDSSAPDPVASTVSDLAQRCSAALSDAQVRFVEDQARRAQAVMTALGEPDPERACAALDAKDQAYLALHDPLVRFMADAFAWVYRHGGAPALTAFHLATADAQRTGFEKWEHLPVAEFAALTAFLLRQHMGRVTVEEDTRRFTFRQSPCGSGGRLIADGAYDGPDALSRVDEPGPLSFGAPPVPVYCTHCAIWNGAATLRWFGRVHWVFEQPARPDGGCTLNLYKRREDTPEAYVRRVALPAVAPAP